MNLLEEKNRVVVENSNLKRQLDELGSRLSQNPNFIPHMLNGEQVTAPSACMLYMQATTLYCLLLLLYCIKPRCYQGSCLNEYFESDDESDVRNIFFLEKK